MDKRTNAVAMLFDIAPNERWARMVDWISDESRLRSTRAEPIQPTGEPVDDESDCIRANTFFAHFVCDALAKAGRTDLVLAHIRRQFGPMIERGATTLWESFDPAASLCHGFSSTPTYQLSTKIVGITPTEPGFRAFRFKPELCDLQRASGSVPTPAGPITVDLRRTEESIHAYLGIPQGCASVVSAPMGWTVTRDTMEPLGRRVEFRPSAPR